MNRLTLDPEAYKNIVSDQSGQALEDYLQMLTKDTENVIRNQLSDATEKFIIKSDRVSKIPEFNIEDLIQTRVYKKFKTLKPKYQPEKEAATAKEKQKPEFTAETTEPKISFQTPDPKIPTKAKIKEPDITSATKQTPIKITNISDAIPKEKPQIILDTLPRTEKKKTTEKHKKTTEKKPEEKNTNKLELKTGQELEEKFKKRQKSITDILNKDKGTSV
jgi:hypothetical protein